MIRTNQITHCIEILQDHSCRLELVLKNFHWEIEAIFGVLGSTFSNQSMFSRWIFLKAQKSQFCAKMSMIGRRVLLAISVCCENQDKVHCRDFARYREPYLLASRVDFEIFLRLITLFLVIRRIVTYLSKDAFYEIPMNQIN